ncbi:MAG: hypothetical protein IKI73_00880, partial [Firmicutes bacterium]|nr:hypothetical protein [Bacillota bacterium]
MQQIGNVSAFAQILKIVREVLLLVAVGLCDLDDAALSGDFRQRFLLLFGEELLYLRDLRLVVACTSQFCLRAAEVSRGAAGDHNDGEHYGYYYLSLAFFLFF